MKTNRNLRMILLLVIMLGVSLLLWEYGKSKAQKAQQDALTQMMDSTEEETIPETEMAEPVILAKYYELYSINPEIIGWLSIEGMKIDYPVMQGQDNEYYLHNDFYGAASKYGCLFVKDFVDVNTPDTNCIIYGHNMKDGSMFGDLDLYREKEFFENHKVISFDTLYEERDYEIVAVCLSQVYYENDDVFKYYEFSNASTEGEFQSFYENIKELALYDTGVSAEYGDTFITLSTCAYHVEDGRLFVVAKRIE